MLPPMRAGSAALFSRWWTSAVVVDLPFEPVTQTTWGGRRNSSQSGVAKERKNSPMSLSTGIPSSYARAMIGFGVG